MDIRRPLPRGQKQQWTGGLVAPYGFQAPRRRQSNAFGVWAIIFGVTGALLQLVALFSFPMFLLFLFGGAFGLLAFVLGIFGLVVATKKDVGKGFAAAGMVVGLLVMTPPALLLLYIRSGANAV